MRMTEKTESSCTQSGRFVTVTGRELDKWSQPGIADRAQALEALFDRLAGEGKGTQNDTSKTLGRLSAEGFEAPQVFGNLIFQTEVVKQRLTTRLPSHHRRCSSCTLAQHRPWETQQKTRLRSRVFQQSHLSGHAEPPCSSSSPCQRKPLIPEVLNLAVRWGNVELRIERRRSVHTPADPVGISTRQSGNTKERG